MISEKIKEIFAGCEDYELKSIEVTEDNKLVVDYEKIEKPLTEERLVQLLSDLEETNDELREAEEEYSDYDNRVEEFRYCGYNEENPDFHGMCLHLNHLENNINEIDKTINKIRKEIDKYDWEIIEKVCEKHCFEY